MRKDDPLMKEFQCMGEPRTVCCIKWNLQKACAGILSVESLFVAGSLAFFLPSLIRGKTEYQTENLFLSTVILYDNLIFYVILQLIWLCTNTVALLALRFVVPYLLLPHFFVSVVAFVVGAVLLGYTIDRLTSWPSDTTPGVILLLSLAIFLIVEVYISSVKLRCFRLLVKRKKAVQGTCEDKPAVVAEVDRLSSYSRRSTVIITDDYYEPPPRV